MDYHFRDREAHLYLRKGEMSRLLSPIDKAVMKAIQGRHVTGPVIEHRTGLSRMAILLASYRLTGLGLLVQRDPRKKSKRRK